MEDELPVKLIELSDFLRSPSILSSRLQFKSSKSNTQLIKTEQGSNRLQFKQTLPGIVLLKQKFISSDDHPNAQEDERKTKELIVPKDVIIFADEIDRKKLGLIHKSNRLFSRHLLITSGAALQALISPLTNAKEWIILCKLKYSKCYTKQTSIHGNVLISLNITHPLVRYEILTALDLLQQSFHEIKSAYIVIDFSSMLIRWFKNYLQRTDQYPSLMNRFFYRYQFQTCQCSVTLGKRQDYQQNIHSQLGNTLQKLLHNYDIPMQISIDFNSLPTNVYSIELNNIFIYSMNNDYKQIIKDMGNGLSLVYIHDLMPGDEITKKSNSTCVLEKKEEEEIVSADKIIRPQHEIDETSSILSSYEPNEQERILFDKLWENRRRIQMQHQHLMIKAAHLLCFTSNQKSSDLQSIKALRY